MKVTTSVNFKKAAAGDKETTNGKTVAVKPVVYMPSNPKAVKRGFLKMFVDFVVKRGSASAEDLVKGIRRSAGREQENHQGACDALHHLVQCP